MWELTKSFRFEAAHALPESLEDPALSIALPPGGSVRSSRGWLAPDLCFFRRFLGAGSEEIHGHSFRAEVTLRGLPDPVTGMIVDLGLLERRMTQVRALLDHKLLNTVEWLGAPTLENLSRFIWERMQGAGHVTKVSVHRDSCNESCAYFGPIDPMTSPGTA